MRKMEDGSESPYELNTTYLSALADPKNESLGRARFYAPRRSPFQCEGIPAIFPFFAVRKTSSMVLKKLTESND